MLVGNIRSLLIIGLFITNVGFFFACEQKQSPIDMVDEEPPPVEPQPTLLDSVLGTHSGTCHYIHKNVETGEVYTDTTYDSSVEIIRTSPEYVRSIGCGAPLYSFSMPEGSTKTEFYSAQTAANAHGYSFKIWINLTDRTIKTQSEYVGNPIGPYRKINEGMFTF